jgi:hypothetical protein
MFKASAGWLGTADDTDQLAKARVCINHTYVGTTNVATSRMDRRAAILENRTQAYTHPNQTSFQLTASFEARKRAKVGLEYMSEQAAARSTTSQYFVGFL